jgi:hypothetical protein
MVGRLSIGLVLGFALAAVAFVLFAMGAEAHATGSFHWVNSVDWWGNYITCLHSPSGVVMYCR